jgi:hypothetical protein
MTCAERLKQNPTLSAILHLIVNGLTFEFA